ncbi:hypothetical protein [Pseudonocardia sp. MH-G8]|uniref:hypothetical protein n=1 Tax=Pseudonocardia sp. MH-G8 TaxID=1854588 RepID=UPI00117A9523|nr:hypothetical protein [Pseudonocardia sp. MH-G8]
MPAPAEPASENCHGSGGSSARTTVGPHPAPRFLGRNRNGRVTETNWIKAPLWFAPIGALVTGAAWRPAANRAHITTTLERIRAVFEQPDD